MKTEYLFPDIFSGDMSEAYLEGMKTPEREFVGNSIQ